MAAKKTTTKDRSDLAGHQHETNRRLGRIEKTLETSSKLFELMHGRLEHLEEGQNALIEGQRSLVEGQRSLVEGQRSLVEGQKQVIARLDQLVEAAIRDRTEWAGRFDSLEARVSALEQDRDRDEPAH